jgi:hypothetical protein
MRRVPVFVSYRFEEDEDLKSGLVEQAAREDSPFWVKDYSLPGPIDPPWERNVESRIGQCELVLVICGPNVHSSEGITKEVQMAKRLGKPVHLLDAGKRGRSRPKGVPEDQPFHGMDWASLKKLVHGAGGV